MKKWNFTLFPCICQKKVVPLRRKTQNNLNNNYYGNNDSRKNTHNGYANVEKKRHN